MTIRPPIFVEEHGALMTFATSADAETWVEAVDVLNDEYRFYDSRGLVLRGRVIEPTPRGPWARRRRTGPQTVRLVEDEAGEVRADELTRVLVDYLERNDPTNEVNRHGQTLDDLVQEVARLHQQ